MPDGQSASLEQELGDLLDQERFEPPEEFVSQALITDESEHEAAAEDPEGWWAKQAGRLHWFEEWDTVLNDTDPPNYKWFEGGKINASYNCLDRHVEDGRGDRVAFHWRGEEGEERDVTYAELLADTQRLANALKDRGIGAGDVVGIFLPMIPEVVVAMLACARIGAPHNVVFGGFSAESVKERMEFSEAKALITVDGARRKGKTAPIKDAGRRGHGRPRPRSRRSSSSATPTPTARCRTGATSGTTRSLEAADDDLRGRAARRRAPAVHPLLERLDGQAEGHPAQHRRLPDPGRPGPTSTSSTSRPTRTSTGARPTSAGSPGTPTSSTARCSTARRA